ncbi:MAG: ABC transporter permease [Anaerolineae bacterium]|nr:ABC transporter permease [Anaerolineae bacterium]
METAQTPTLAPVRSSVWLRRNAPLLVVYGLIIILSLGASIYSDRFLNDRNIFNILRQAAFLGTAALGQTFVILTGGIDLSVGSVVKLTILTSAIIMNGRPENTWPAILAVLLMGAFIGAIHALLITRLNIAPFIVTLGSYSILRGIALRISTSPVGKASPEVLRFYDQRIGSVPIIVIGFVILLLITIFVLRRTPFGRYIYAVGGNEQVARLSGIPVNRVKFGVYMLCGMFAALTGLLLLSRYGVGDPVIGDGMELDTITAVVLGGTSLFGGRGGMIGTFGGVLLLGLITNLLVVLNVNQWIRDLIQGIVIVSAVALYKQKGRQ